MLAGHDSETFLSLRLLHDVVAEHRKPLVLWVGAGVSMWGGFPSWQETASLLASKFRRHEPKYDPAEGQRLLREEKFPELFELLRKTNPQNYRRELASIFASRVPPPVYRRFLTTLAGIAPLQIVTTNVDEMLEHNLPDSVTLQASDLERCLDFLPARTPFVAKIHGSVSSIDSVVFTTTDYENLVKDSTYLQTLASLLSQSIVVFVGYSLRDKYVLDLLQVNAAARPLFGDGPHFLVQSTETPPLPDNVRSIRYLPEPHADHRSAITVLDIIRVTENTGTNWFRPDDLVRRPVDNEFSSAYFLTDVTPPGT